jgi:hypothetical protein
MTAAPAPCVFGGEHGLSLPISPAPNSLHEELTAAFPHLAWFASGRDAFGALVTASSPWVWWLPDYCCASLYQPLLAASREIRRYAIREDFGADLSSLADLRPEHGIVLVHFFGFLDEALHERVLDSDALGVLDITHSLLNLVRVQPFFSRFPLVLASLRKIGPFPDLGLLGSASPTPPAAWPRIAPHFRTAFSDLRTESLQARHRFLTQGDDPSVHLANLETAERLLDETREFGFCAGELSLSLLHGFSADTLRRRTQTNLEFMRSRLPEALVVPEIVPAGCSPWLPMTLPDRASRDALRVDLRRHQMFLPVHWPPIFETSHPFSDHLLSIPCDYRYNSEQLARVIHQIKDSLHV